MTDRKLEAELTDLIRLIQLPRRYTMTLNDWFFPAELIPHSTKLKYRCNKLYENGLLERQGAANNRWGYRYRIKRDETKL